MSKLGLGLRQPLLRGTLDSGRAYWRNAQIWSVSLGRAKDGSVSNPIRRWRTAGHSNGLLKRRRPLWQPLGLLVALAWGAHEVVVRLVETGVAPQYVRGASLCFWSLGVVSFLAFEALAQTPNVRNLMVEWTLVIFGYTLATSVFFLPYLTRMNREIVGDSDSFQVVWNAWWVERALRSGQSLFFTDLVWFPIGSPLVFHFLVPVESMLVMILKPVMGLVPSYNLMVIAAFPIAGAGSYALARAMNVGRVASFVGGFVLAWSPFLTSRLSWPDLSYCGPLAFLAAALMRAIPLNGEKPSRRALAGLALAALFVQFTGDVTAVLAANLVLAWLCACMLYQRSLWRPIQQFAHACFPALLVLLPYLAMVIRFALTWDIPIRRHGLKFVPEPLSYFLPLARGSVYSHWLVTQFGLHQQLTMLDLACYLGILVLPLAIAGWYCSRSRPEIRFWCAIFVVFLILSIGPRLLFERVPVQFLGHSVPLPFALWQRLPLLGIVAQSGRYLLLGYIAIAVGVAMLVDRLRHRLSNRRWQLAVVAITLAIGIDYAFAPNLVTLPDRPVISQHPGTVMDVRIYHGETMYYQTQHGRPLVGGYLSRPVPAAQRLYLADPCLAWLMYKEPRELCGAESLRSALARLAVTDVFMNPGDPRGSELGLLGFVSQYQDDRVAVWSVPESWRQIAPAELGMRR